MNNFVNALFWCVQIILCTEAFAAPTITLVSTMPSELSISTQPTSVNINGDVVGIYYSVEGTSNSYPFRYTSAAGFENLSALIGQAARPFKISDDATILYQKESSSAGCFRFDPSSASSASIACQAGVYFPDEGRRYLAGGSSVSLPFLASEATLTTDDGSVVRISLPGKAGNFYSINPISARYSIVSKSGNSSSVPFLLDFKKKSITAIKISASEIKKGIYVAGVSDRGDFLMCDYKANYVLYLRTGVTFERHQLNLSKSWKSEGMSLNSDGDLIASNYILKRKGKSGFELLDFSKALRSIFGVAVEESSLSRPRAGGYVAGYGFVRSPQRTSIAFIFKVVN